MKSKNRNYLIALLALFCATFVFAVDPKAPASAAKFTADGSTPSRSTGTSYSLPITVSSNQTVKAIAYKDYHVDSAVASAAYVISGGPSYVTTVDPGSTTDDETIYNTYTLAAKITLTAGTVSKVQVYVTSVSATNPTLKVALLNSSFASVADGSETITAPSGPINDWKGAVGLSASVSAGTYYVAYVCSAFDGAITGRKVTGSSGDGIYDFDVNYAGFPTGIASPGDSTANAAVRVEITP